MARIVVCGYMIRYPVVGMMFAYFHYVLGLHRLGHEVLYLEESGWPQSCYDPEAKALTDDPSYGIRNLKSWFSRFGLEIPICYVDRTTGHVEGLEWSDAKSSLSSADLLLNVGGVCWLPEFHLCRRRVLIDMDPFFTQIGKIGLEGRNDYQVYFSYGSNIGHPNCSIPTNGIDWLATAPPVIPDLWARDVSDNLQSDRPLTTIANWKAYGDATYQRESYGQKDLEFSKLLTLPSRVNGQRLELALSGIDSSARTQLRDAGWNVRNAAEISHDVSAYQDYIRSSRAEFSTAKNAYVKTHSGWFSDRSVCYLASGLPVILQDSGFSDWLPTGRGVLPFSSVDEAVACIERMNSDYSNHQNAARELSETVFSYKAVLPRIVDLSLGARHQGNGLSPE
jgi:hypothetical protein